MNTLEEENHCLKIANEEMKTDLKNVIEIFFKMGATIGMVNEDKTMVEKISIKKITSEVMGILTSAMNPFSDKEDLEKQFSFLKEIVPIYEKYKDL